MPNPLTFTGRSSGAYPYITHEVLVETVNIALFLEKPLLLEGEPGCGKTTLAYALANELELPIFHWRIHSSSQVQDGIYRFNPTINRSDDPYASTFFGTIGQAFMSQQRAVVLIDEIDKAGFEFADDLLPTLNPPWEFFIPETNQRIVARQSPIFVVTNNQSQDVLNDAFMRRCVYYYIPFPAQHALEAIAGCIIKTVKSP